MSLLTTHGASNFVITSGWVQTYSIRYIQGQWNWAYLQTSGVYTQMKEFHRYTKMGVKFVGMTYSAAVALKDELVSGELNRTVRQWYWDDSVTNGDWKHQDGTAETADISVVPAGGNAYDVVVNINDDDVRFAKVGEIFTAEYAFQGYPANHPFTAYE